MLVLPVLFEGEVKAVIELASFLPFSQIHQLFLDQFAESVGVVINMIAANMRTAELLEQSQSLTLELQSQSEELRKQQEELKRSNAELEAQATTLRTSEELLKDQQEELQQVNEELEEKASLLAEQNRKVESKNEEVEGARARSRGEGRAAGVELQVQVGVPRQHVARAAHSAQQPAHPRTAPQREQGWKPQPRSRSSSRKRFLPRAATCSISSTTCSICRRSRPARWM